MKMKIPEAKGYSIWLMFDKESELRIKNVIEYLSKEYNTPNFEPHLTLLSKIETSNYLFEKFSQLVDGLNSFEISVQKLNYSDEFYKSVFLEIEKSDILIYLFLKAKKLFKTEVDFTKFNPHISIIYSDSSQEIKKSIIQKFVELNSLKVRVNKVVLVNTEGTPEKWQELITVQI